MYNVGLAGFGLAGKTFHAPLIAATEGLTLKKIVSSRQSEINEIYPETIVVSDFSDLLTDEIDIIVLATPNLLHFEQATMALKAGKAVVVDKPFTETLEQAKKLLDLARTENKLLTVFHNRRLDGDFMSAKEIIQSGQLGRVTYFESNFNRFRPEVDKDNWRESTKHAGGIFFDLAPHLIDQALDIFGPPIKVLLDIDFIRDEAVNDDYFHLIFKYEKCSVHLNASTICKTLPERFIVHGTKGSFSKYGMDPQEKNLKHGMKADSADIGRDQESNYGVLAVDNTKKIKTTDGNYREFYQNLKDTIDGKDSLMVSAHEAFFVMEIMELCLRSFKEQKWIDVEL